MPVILTPIDGACIGEGIDLLDTTCDWRVYDGLVSITLWKRAPVPTSTTINNSLFRFTEDEEAQVSDGVYIRFTGIYFLPAELITGTIAVGDYIVDNDDNVWVIQKVDRPYELNIGVSWQLFVNSLRFNLPLSNTINYYSVNADVDNYGGRRLEKELLYDNLIVHIQPIDSADETIANRIYHNTTHFIYIEEDLETRIGDLIKDDEDNWYKVEAVANRTRIDEFTKLIVKQVIDSEEIDGT